MSRHRLVVAGAPVFAKIETLRQQVRRSSSRPDCLDSDALADFHRDCDRAGYLEAEIVETVRGYSLRFASGLQNFGLIARSLPSFHAAQEVAHEWQAKAPALRYVTARCPHRVGTMIRQTGVGTFNPVEIYACDACGAEWSNPGIGQKAQA